MNNGFDVSYTKVGNGKNVVVTFPGVGMTERYFENYFKNELDHTFYHFSIKVTSSSALIDLPTIWKQFFIEFLEKEEIDNCELIAYSIGARLFYPLNGLSQLTKVSLICPDGVVDQVVYRLVTQTWLGKRMFFIVFPLVKMLNPKIAKYVNLSPLELFLIWKRYSVLKFPSKINHNVTVFLAKKDIVIPNEKVVKVLKNKKIERFLFVNCTHFSILPMVRFRLL